MSEAYPARSFNLDADLPEELTVADQWVCWIYKHGAKKPGKEPVDPRTLKNLSWGDPSTWLSFDQAVEAYRNNPQLNGIGIILTAELGLIGGDLDHAIDLATGEVHEWARTHVGDFDTYTEITPGADGFRLFVCGELPQDAPRKVGNREIYDAGRFLTITGNAWNDSPIAADRTPAVDRYIGAMRAERKDRTGSESAAVGGSNEDELAALFAGVNLHDTTRDLPFRLLDDGMKPGKVVEFIRAAMKAMPDKGEPSRWQERYNDIPRSVRTAAEVLARREAEMTPSNEIDRRWGFTFADEMTRNLGPTRWLVQKLIPEDCTGVLYGPSGCLKSFVMLDISLSLAHGTPWQGKATKLRTVYYLAGEGKQGFAKRIAAWCAERALDAPTNFAFRQIPRIQDVADMARLIIAIRSIASERGQAGLIVIDTLFTALDGGDENSGKDMGQIIAAMNQLRDEFGAAVFAVHHTGKVGDSSRGHSSLPSGMDVMLFAKPGPTPLTVEITNPKQKDGAEHPSMLLQAIVHELPIVGEDGQRETSLVLCNPVAAIMANYQAKAKQTEEKVAKAQAAKQAREVAAERVKALVLERFAEGATLVQVETEVGALATSLGFPDLARGKSTLSEWKKQAGL